MSLPQFPDGPLSICETCGEPIDPDAPSTIRAYEVIETKAFGTEPQRPGRLAVFLHAHHFPAWNRRYRRVEPSAFSVRSGR